MKWQSKKNQNPTTRFKEWCSRELYKLSPWCKSSRVEGSGKRKKTADHNHNGPWTDSAYWRSCCWEPAIASCIHKYVLHQHTGLWFANCGQEENKWVGNIKEQSKQSPLDVVLISKQHHIEVLNTFKFLRFFYQRHRLIARHLELHAVTRRLIERKHLRVHLRRADALVSH